MATLSNLERPTMRFSRHRHSYGIVIYAEFEDTYGVSRWHPVRNFGDNQSEAYYFMRYAYELKESRLRMLVESYDPEVVVVNGDRKFGELNKIKKKHPELIYSWIPRSYGAKDISDLHKLVGRNKVKSIIVNYLKKILL